MTYFWNKDNFYWDGFIHSLYWVKTLLFDNFYWDGFIHSLYCVKTLLFDNFYFCDSTVRNLRDENFIISNFYWDDFIHSLYWMKTLLFDNFYWDDFIHSLYWVKTLLFDNFNFCGYIVRNLGEWWEICTGAGFTHSLYYFVSSFQLLTLMNLNITSLLNLSDIYYICFCL